MTTHTSLPFSDTVLSFLNSESGESIQEEVAKRYTESLTKLRNSGYCKETVLLTINGYLKDISTMKDDLVKLDKTSKEYTREWYTRYCIIRSMFQLLANAFVVGVIRSLFSDSEFEKSVLAAVKRIKEDFHPDELDVHIDRVLELYTQKW